MGSARRRSFHSVGRAGGPASLRHHSRVPATPGLPSPLDLLWPPGRSLSLGLQTEVLRGLPAAKVSLAFSGPREGNEVKRRQENS